MEKKLKAHVLILQLPIGAGKKFSGVIDLVSFKELLFDEESGVDYKITDVSEKHRGKSFKI